MKVSFNWLRELVELKPGVTADSVAKQLSLVGLEVESIERRTGTNWQMIGVVLMGLLAVAGFMLRPLQVTNESNTRRVTLLEQHFREHEHLAAHPTAAALHDKIEERVTDLDVALQFVNYR